MMPGGVPIRRVNAKIAPVNALLLWCFLGLGCFASLPFLLVLDLSVVAVMLLSALLMACPGFMLGIVGLWGGWWKLYH